MARTGPAKRSGDSWLPTEVDRAYDLAALGHTISEIATALDRSRPAVQRILLEDRERYDEAKAKRADLVIREVRSRGFDRKDIASKFFLDKLAMIEWLDYREAQNGAQRVEISGPEGEPIQVEGRRMVTLAEVNAFVDALNRDAGLRDPGEALPAAPDVLPDPPVD